MRAVMIERYGGPDVVEVRDVPVPDIGPGEVLVQVACAGINRMDIGTRRGQYATSTTYPVRLPCTLGVEGAGEVVRVGDGVTAVKAGDRVAWCVVWGSFADYARIPAASAALIPDDVSYELAATVMYVGCTAHYLWNDAATLTRGQTCLVHAAAGNIGQVLVQMALRSGVEVIATASSPAKRAVVAALGARHVIGYGENGGFADEVRAITGGDGVDVVFDALTGPTLRGSLRSTRTRGLIVNYGAVAAPVTDFNPLELGEAGSLYLTRPRLRDHMADQPTVQRRADDTFAALRDGWLTMATAGRYTVETIGDALDLLADPATVGKPVLHL